MWLMEETAVCYTAKKHEAKSLRIVGMHCSLAVVAHIHTHHYPFSHRHIVYISIIIAN